MDANNENVRRKLKRKIPIPLKSLPALPKHLLNKNLDKSVIEKRHPLKTLVQTNVDPSTSNYRQEKAVTKRKCQLNDETKYVTMRRTDDLDWDLNVVKNQNKSFSSRIPIPLKSLPALPKHLLNKNLDKSAIEKRHPLKTLVQTNVDPGTSNYRQEKTVTKRKCQLNVETKYVTKRRLRDLNVFKDHISNDDVDMNFKLPTIEEESMVNITTPSEKSPPQLKPVQKLEPHNYLKTPYTYTSCMNEDDTDFMLDYLLKVERKPLAVPTIPGKMRACVINWLMRVNKPLGNPAVIQSACWYLDSFLGTSHVQLDKLRVVAAACFWIALKLYPGPKVSAAMLVNCSDNAFTQKELVAVEKAVLQKLGFPVQPVIPHEFITYIASWCGSTHRGEIEVAATFIYMTGLLVEKQLCEEYPSVLACAAVRSAVLLLEKKDMMKHVERCPIYRAVGKKASTSLYNTCAVLRCAVRIVGDDTYEYEAPLDQYGVRPHFIAQRIIMAAQHHRSVLLSLACKNI